MTRLPLLFAWALSCFMTALLVAEQNQSLPSFRSSINTVSLNVTVTDQSSRCFSRRPSYYSGSWDGCLVADLSADSFEVFEDGVKHDVSVFHPGQLPVAISVLIEAGLQMKGAVAEAKDAAIGFTRKLRPEDLAEIVSSVAR